MYICVCVFKCDNGAPFIVDNMNTFIKNKSVLRFFCIK